MTELLPTDPQVKLLRDLHEKVTRGEPALIGGALGDAADEIERLTTIKKNLVDALYRKEERIKRMEREHIEELRELQRGGMSWEEATR